MILAGIDEAGYGPLLGPLTVGCCAFEVQGDAAGQIPCLWKKLGKLISRSRSKTGRKIHVNDSKEVYSPAQGLKELERSIVAVLLSWGKHPASFDEFLAAVAPDAIPGLAQHPWYHPPDAEAFPFEQEMLGLSLFARGLCVEMERCGASCVHLGAQVLPERQLNDLLARTLNKASVNFSLAARHIDFLLRAFGPRHLTIFCDRQGGREHYGHLLRLMFEDWPLEIIREEDGYAEYVLNPPAGAPPAPDGSAHPPVRLIFREKAESQAMPVALASMLAKYLREGLMRRFNAFWRLHVPGVEPTAGYYNDGQRFLQQIDLKRREMGIGDEVLIRVR